MAKKSKNKHNKKHYDVKKIDLRDTRLKKTLHKKARPSSLRFSPFEPIDFVALDERPEPPIRRETPRVSVKVDQGIKRLTLNAPLVHDEQKKPDQVCKRRHERKQIIHALGKAGSGGQKRPDNKNRDVKC